MPTATVVSQRLCCTFPSADVLTASHPIFFTSFRLSQESCVTATALALRGRLYFEFVGDSTLLDVHVFEATAWHGTPAETEEVRLAISSGQIEMGACLIGTTTELCELLLP